MSDYKDIANLSWDKIQEPKPGPVGTYLLKGSNGVFQPAKEEGKSPVVMFVHTIKEAMDDVSSAELAELGEGYDLTENKVFTRIFIEDGSSWLKVRDILLKHDVKLSNNVLEDLKKVKGAEVLGYLTIDRFKRDDGTMGENNKVETWASVNE